MPEETKDTVQEGRRIVVHAPVPDIVDPAEANICDGCE